MTLNESYEYAGFHYKIEINENDGIITATPKPGQHRAANKYSHCQAAVEQYKQEHDGIK